MSWRKLLREDTSWRGILLRMALILIVLPVVTAFMLAGEQLLDLALSSVGM